MTHRVLFGQVDHGAARELVAMADVTKMPCIHVYGRGELRLSRIVNNKQLFEGFQKDLVEVVLKLGAFEPSQ